MRTAKFVHAVLLVNASRCAHLAKLVVGVVVGAAGMGRCAGIAACAAHC